MKNISISFKIAIGFVLILIIFIVINFLSINNLEILNEDDEWVKHTHEVLEKIEVVLGDMKDAETGQRGYLITGLENYLEPFNNATNRVTKNINELQRLTIDNPRQQLRIIDVKHLITSKFEELQQTIDLRKNVGFEAAKLIVIGDKGKEIMDNIRLKLQEMTIEENKLLLERTTLGIKNSKKIKTTTIMLTIIAIIIIFILIIYYTRIIALPIKKLSIIAEEIAMGNLTSEIKKTNKKDEIGLLMNSFRSMQQNLRKKAVQAEEIAKGNLTLNIVPLSDKDSLGIAFASMTINLRTQMKEISAGANTLSTSSIKLMTMMNQLSQSYAETATSVSETSSTIEELKQTAEISSQEAARVAESGQKLAIISHEGNKSIQKTIEGLKNIKQQMESIAGIVILLSEKSQTIGEIAITVNDIAEQSNLLAVNASIEAAKAGDQGKGFAVVAQEIKNLAKLSKESTVKIRNVLTNIQKDISGSVLATEEGGKVIDKGIELSYLSNEVITTLSENVDQASNINLQISASSKQQLIGFDQINSAMESIKEATYQNSESTKQTEESIFELKELGEKLLKTLSQYKLK